MTHNNQPAKRSLQQSIIRVATGTVLLLLIPLIAMQFSNEIRWSAIDFALVGVLLFGGGLAVSLIARNIAGKTSQVVAGAIVLAILFLVWGELAVGLVGTRWAGS